MVSSAQQQYLKSLLSQCGPDNLPYSEEVRDLIEQHLLTLTQDFPSLVILPAPFVEDDGTTLQLLQADGTIPMTFGGSSYNIPVTMWLLESYPIASPRVFVSPTGNMVINPHHRCVSRSGVVSLPYLDKWAYPHSNLADLTHSLSSTFGLDPPLFTKTVPLGNASPSSSSSQLSPRTSRSLPLTSNMIDHPFSSTLQPKPNSSWLSPSSSAHRPQLPTEQYIDPSEVFRQNAIKALSERMDRGLVEHQRMRDTDMKKLAATEAWLKTRHKQLMLAVDRQRQEQEALEYKLQFIRTNTDLVETWLANNGKLQGGEIDIDDAFVPCDTPSKQMLENLSADCALEDVLYSLDKAVQQGCMPMDAYLKHVRAIAHEQFFYRATAMRVEAIQRQAKISNMAARYVP